jgi:hypothetical protein
VENVKDSPQRSQLKGAPSRVIKPIIELPCDPIGQITNFKVVNNNVRQLGNFVTLFCNFKNVIPLKREDTIEVRNIFLIKSNCL